MIKVGIIGCGKIADEHCAHIKSLEGCELAGFADCEELMARQLAERMGSERYYTDAARMIESVKLDAVHITTPPGSHFELGNMCINAGIHTYIEKPFTLDVLEAEKLIASAEEKNVILTVGHDHQYSTAARRMRKLIAGGALGDSPLHLESYYSYNLSNALYAQALLGDSGHWVRSLPGKLLQNVISHGVAKVAEYLEGENLKITASGNSSPVLKSMGEDGIIDELRVILSDSNGTTAYFTFSSQMNPGLHLLRAFGSKGGLILDCNQQSVIRIRGQKYKSYLEHFFPPFYFSAEYMKCFGINVLQFLRKELHMKSGMRYLIKEFYRSILEGKAPPIPYREIVLTTRIMDEIFRQVQPSPMQNHSFQAVLSS